MNKLCGCCEGIEILTPMTTANRPGLDALTYRAGTHATFLATMQARLSNYDLEIPLKELDDQGKPKTTKSYPLQSLGTRTSDDPAIALLDAWATVADVLTFYQERIANEGYLRTAIERRSIVELARLVGYRPHPGVAASVYTAFTLEEGYDVEIPAGTRAQSLPAPGELPQSFETSEPLEAHAEWNQLKPRMTRPSHITGNPKATTIDTSYLQGTVTNLKPNDPILFVFGNDPNPQILRKVKSAEAQSAENRTKVTLQQTPTLTAAAFIDEVRRTVEQYLDLDVFDVASNSRMAQSVVSLLGEVRARLSPAMSSENLAALLEESLPPLRSQRRIADEMKYARLEPWLSGLVATFEKIGGRLYTGRSRRTIGDASHEPTSPNNPGEASHEHGGSDPVNLDQALKALAKPPSLQPANRLRLTRSITQTFAPRADVGPQLLATFTPRLKTTLYRAWANAELTPSPALQSVETLRVKAAPFGHNAPLKPIYDDKGAIESYEEWPLAGARTISVRLFAIQAEQATILDAFDSGAVQVHISIQQAADVWSTQVALGDQQSMSVPPDTPKVHITVTRESPDDYTTITTGITFEFVESDQKIIVRPQRTPNMTIVGFFIGIHADPEQLVSRDQSLRYSMNGRKVALALAEDLSIADESPSQAPSDLQRTLTLDASYDNITPESWVVIERPGEYTPIIRRVVEVKTISKAAYGITGKVTQLTLDQSWLFPSDLALSVLRETTVYAQSEALVLAEEPIEDDVAEDTIELDGLYGGLEAGRWVIVAGERTDIPGTSGVKSSELVMLAGVTQDVQKISSSDESADEPPRARDLPGDKTHTTLQLANGLEYTYKRDTVTIYGNVVKATHGETRTEVLGSGDNSRALQQFTLKQSPLTYLAASTPAGAESTLRARVNDILWHETDRLAGLGPNDRRYVTRTDDEDKTTVVFGNGQHGARLPTGLENVTAAYRTGIGKPGNVAAEQISLLSTRPLGVKSVMNPLPATGGADRETLNQARRNAPLAVMALDRLVSVQDYADFARTFAGIGKASAVRLSDGRRQLVHLTIAGADDIPIDESSDLYRNLCQALHRFGDPHQPVKVDLRELMLLVISAQVRVSPDYQWESVEPKIQAALLETFGFERRELGQHVLLSEVISVIQGVAGVGYVDVDILDSVSEDITPDQFEQLTDNLSLNNRIVVNLAGVDPTTADPVRRIRPAQLAYLSREVPDTLILTERSL